jgi:cytochrome c oxidase subunit 2
MRWRGALISPLALLEGCNNRGNQDILNSAGIQAQRIEHLWWIIFWVTLVVFILVMSFLGRSFSRRQDVGGLTMLPASPAKDSEAHLSVSVSAAVLVTIVILFVLLVVSISTGKSLASLQSKNAVTIEVTGHQWWWEVKYPNPIASDSVTTANEIHVPVGIPVVLNSTSQDVIHSFWAPNIHGKRDLIPGYQTAMWFQADREGVFRGQCAEFCGHQHAHMAFLLIAESPAKFQAWLQQQRQSAAAPGDAVAIHGQQVFLSSTCVMCHTIRGTDAGSKNGPDLTHLASRGTLAAGTLPNTRGNLAGWILDSQRIKPGNHMPPNSFSSDDLQALLVYLEGLQ